MRRKGDTVKIDGGYQHRAITDGFIVQRVWHNLKVDLIERVLPPERGDRILDLGCGSGYLTHFLAKTGKYVIGIDGNKKAIDYAKQTFYQTNLEYCHTLFDEIRFKTEQFSKIYLIEVVEHLYENQINELLKEVHRILQPEGSLLLTTPNYKSLWPIIEKLMDFFSLAPRLADDQHVTRLTINSLKSFPALNSFKKIHIGRFMGLSPFLSILGKAIAYKLNEVEFRFKSPMGNLIYLIAVK